MIHAIVKCSVVSYIKVSFGIISHGILWYHSVV